MHRHRHIASSERPCRVKYGAGALRGQGDRVRLKRGDVRPRSSGERPARADGTGYAGETGCVGVSRQGTAPRSACREYLTMRRGEDAQHFDGPVRRWAGDSPGDRLGPQGAALILELQRLRRGFEVESPQEPRAPKPRRPARDGAARDRRPPSHRTKRPQKGKMERAIDVCLEQFGFKAADPAGRRNETQGEPPAPPPRRNETQSEPPAPPPRRNETQSEPPTPPLRRQGRVVTADDPLAMNLPKLGPDSSGPDRLMMIESPPLALPRASETERAAGQQWITRCRAGLTAGANFIVGRGGLAEYDATAGDSLMSRTGWAYEHELRTGLRILLIAGVLGGGWLALVPLAGAVVVPGNLVVQSNVKSIQHPTGGVVAEIKVHDGMHINAGDLLVRLDATQTQANLQMVNKQLELIAGELNGVQDLYDKHLVPLTRLTTLQREAARIEGERGQLTSAIAETKSKIGEAQLQIVRIDQDFRTDVVKELGETQGK